MEERVDDLVIHGGPDRLPAHGSIRHAIAVLRRIGGIGDEVALAVIDQEIEKKLRGFFHDGIRFAAQESAVQAVLIVFPEMQRHPRAAHRPDAAIAVIDGRRIAPGIEVVMKNKAARAIHFLGSAAAALEVRLDQVEERPGGFREIADFGRPVIHLDIDVGGVLAVPWRSHAFVPDAL